MGCKPGSSSRRYWAQKTQQLQLCHKAPKTKRSRTGGQSWQPSPGLRPPLNSSAVEDDIKNLSSVGWSALRLTAAPTLQPWERAHVDVGSTAELWDQEVHGSQTSMNSMNWYGGCNQRLARLWIGQQQPKALMLTVEGSVSSMTGLHYFSRLLGAAFFLHHRNNNKKNL